MAHPQDLLTEKQFRESEHARNPRDVLFHFLVECISDYAIYMLDPQGRVLTWNTGAERMLGYEDHEIVGKHFSIFYTPEDQASGKPSRLLKTAMTEGRVEESEWRVKKDSSKFWANAIIVPIYYEMSEPPHNLYCAGRANPRLCAGSELQAISKKSRHNENRELLGFAKVLRDLTEQKRVDQIKTDLISFASHQLKTPLAEIYGYVENMLGGLTGSLNSKQKQYLAAVKEISSKNLHLIADLMNVSKIEAGILTTIILPVRLKEIVQITLNRFLGRIKSKGLELIVIDESQEAMILADSQKFIEAISNVVDNAVKFTDKGSITVKITSNDEFGLVEISDTGKGMSREVLDQLFTKAFVLSQTKDSSGGSGLGLYIAKSFMKLQQGDIVASTVPGKGSRFILSLPKALLKNK